MTTKVSCLIPFRNEGGRLEGVLAEAVKTKNIDQIICIDGASSDNGAEAVGRYPEIQLVRMKKNLGKTEAVKAGLEKAGGRYILLLDADLKGLRHEELERVLEKVAADPRIDMVIFKRKVNRWLTRINRMETLYSGERVLKKRDLVEVMKTNPVKFQLEIAVNKYMWDRKKRVYWSASSNVNLPKSKKFGWFSGMIEDMIMFWQVFRYDPASYLLHLLFFCRKKLPGI